MGRLKRYKTKKDLKEARKRWNKVYYEKNKERLNKETMEKYYEEKLEEIQEKLYNLQNNKSN